MVKVAPRCYAKSLTGGVSTSMSGRCLDIRLSKSVIVLWFSILSKRHGSRLPLQPDGVGGWVEMQMAPVFCELVRGLQHAERPIRTPAMGRRFHLSIEWSGDPIVDRSEDRASNHPRSNAPGCPRSTTGHRDRGWGCGSIGRYLR